MLNRCENPKNDSYEDYGGRGITVCERWHKFENFLEDMGERPEGMTLDRWPDNDGNYEPGNCRWTTRLEQNNNCRPKSIGSAKQKWFFAYNENTGEWFESNNQHEFAKKHNLEQNRISSYLRDTRKNHKGWTFQWLPT